MKKNIHDVPVGEKFWVITFDNKIVETSIISQSPLTLDKDVNTLINLYAYPTEKDALKDLIDILLGKLNEAQLLAFRANLHVKDAESILIKIIEQYGSSEETEEVKENSE